MIIRVGENRNIVAIMDIFKKAIEDMDTKGIHQWDDIYPSEDVLLNDISENNIIVSVNEMNTIQGVIVLNEHQDIAYEGIEWKYNLGRQLIIHRLCIHPNFQGKGIARMLIKYAECFGFEHKYESIRLDAFIPNIRACRMYEQSGYHKRGIVTFRKGDFYCYEKGLFK
jgi:ribosomal protein S18 acetylase RimI-like enzyme